MVNIAKALMGVLSIKSVKRRSSCIKKRVHPRSVDSREIVPGTLLGTLWNNTDGTTPMYMNVCTAVVYQTDIDNAVLLISDL